MSRREKRKEPKSAQEVALRLLGSREHSTLELRTKLLKRGYSDTEISKVLTELTAQEYLSDERFTKGYIRFRLSRGDGPLKIRAQLLKRGIDNSLISLSLRDDENFWLSRALDVDRRITVSNKEKDLDPSDYLLRGKRARRLRARGYTASVIAKVLDNHSDSN